MESHLLAQLWLEAWRLAGEVRSEHRSCSQAAGRGLGLTKRHRRAGGEVWRDHQESEGHGVEPRG